MNIMNLMAGKKRFMVVNLDLAKAYDKMEWSFMREALEILHFPKQITELIFNCMSSSSLSINWQGRPTHSFYPFRGIRQGDPIFLLLFVVALERLSHCIQDTVMDGSWIPLKFGRGGPFVSHLLFADDILLIVEASSSTAQKIIDILDVFAGCSGQTVNKDKYCLLFSQNTPPEVSASISAQMGIATTSNLGRYVGIPITSGRKGKPEYSFLIDKIRSKLSGWKASSLSQASRISLAQSCILSIPNYVMHTSKLPTSICDDIEWMCRDFIWGSTPEVRKNHLISWETICAPKELGGLGFRSLRMVNAAYLTKLG